MAQPEQRVTEEQPSTSNGAHKLDALAEQEKNLAIFKTLSSWLSSVVLRGHVFSYYVRPDRDKTDQRRQLSDMLKAEIADGVQRALKTKTGTVVGMQCHKAGSRVLFRESIVYPVLFLKYIGSGQKDYIIIWTRDSKALDDGKLRGLTRLSEDANFARLKVEVFVPEAVHSSGDDLPAEELDDLEKKASELLKVTATNAAKADAPRLTAEGGRKQAQQSQEGRSQEIEKDFTPGDPSR